MWHGFDSHCKRLLAVLDAHVGSAPSPWLLLPSRQCGQRILCALSELLAVVQQH